MTTQPPRRQSPARTDHPVDSTSSGSGPWHANERQSAVLPMAMVESSHPTVVVDDQGKVVSMNLLAAELLMRQQDDTQGWPVEELLGFTIDAILSPTRNPSEDSSGARSTISERVRRRDGLTVPVEITCAHFHFRAQRFTVIHFCDVSKRHANDTRLRQLSLAFEQIADHAVITDDDGTILYVNSAFEEATGHSRASAVGNTMRLIKSGKHAPSFYADLWATLRSGRAFRAEFINRNARGDLYIDEQSIAPFVDDETGTTYYIATGRDVTERRLRDPLTGLPTPAALIDRIAHATARSE